MALNFEQKKAIVAEMADIASKALSAVVSDYRGLTVAEVTELRKKARESNVELRVVRNTLAKRAIAETEFKCLAEVLTGPLILAFAKEEPGAAARVIQDFIKDHDALEVKALALGGKLLSASALKTIASLPSRNEAIASLMSVMKAPMSKFVRTCAEPHAQLVRIIAAIRDKKQAA